MSYITECSILWYILHELNFKKLAVEASEFIAEWTSSWQSNPTILERFFSDWKANFLVIYIVFKQIFSIIKFQLKDELKKQRSFCIYFYKKRSFPVQKQLYSNQIWDWTMSIWKDILNKPHWTLIGFVYLNINSLIS